MAPYFEDVHHLIGCNRNLVVEETSTTAMRTRRVSFRLHIHCFCCRRFFCALFREKKSCYRVSTALLHFNIDSCSRGINASDVLTSILCRAAELLLQSSKIDLNFKASDGRIASAMVRKLALCLKGDAASPENDASQLDELEELMVARGARQRSCSWKLPPSLSS